MYIYHDIFMFNKISDSNFDSALATVISIDNALLH